MVLLPWHRPTNIGMGRHLSVTCRCFLVIYTSSVVLGIANLTSYPATAREGELFTMICSKPGVFPPPGGGQWYRSGVPLFTTCLRDKSIRKSNIAVFNYLIAGRINVSCDSNTHSVTIMINSTVDNGSAWQCSYPDHTQISNKLDIEVYPKDNTINNTTRSTVITTPMSATIATTAVILDNVSTSAVTSSASSSSLSDISTSPTATSDTSSLEYTDTPGETVTSIASSSRLPSTGTSPSATSETSSLQYTETPGEVSSLAPIPKDTNPASSVSASFVPPKSSTDKNDATLPQTTSTTNFMSTNSAARASSSTSPTATSTSSTATRPSSSTTATTTLTTASSTKIATEDAFLQQNPADQTASVGFIVAGVVGGLMVMTGVILAVVFVTRKRGVKKTVIDSTDIYSTMSRDTDTHHYTDLNRMRSVSTRDSGMTSSLYENTDITSDVHVYYNTVTASGEGINHENPRLASSFI